MEEIQRLISLISSTKISQRERDKIFWLVDKKGEYTVKANYRHLEGDTSEAISVGLIWNSCIPPKVSVFTREVWWGKVLTMDQLKKRGFQLTSRCPLCKEDEETIDHFLFHCPSVWGFWVAILSLLGVVWACPLLFKELMVAWATFPIKKKARNTWNAALPCLLWAIWKERNRVVFDNNSFSPIRLKHYFITSLTSWAGIMRGSTLL